MPTFALSVFVMLLSLCEDLKRLMNGFWWGSGTNGLSGIRWMGWKKLCVQRSKGGLNFKSLHEFNLAILSKQRWRFITNPNSLVYRLFKAKYLPKGNFFDAQLGPNPSFIWRSILVGKDLLKSGCVVRNGSGDNTGIWDSPWLPDD